MLRSFLLFSFIGSTFVGATEYSLEFPEEVLAKTSYSYAKSINDNDEVLLNYSGCYALWTNRGIKTIECDNDENHFFKIGNNGLVLGYRSSIIWTENLGIQKINFKEKLRAKDYSISFVDVNEKGQVIGTFLSFDSRIHCFIYDVNNVKEIIFDEMLLENGASIINIRPLKINNKGAIIGYIDYGFKHPLKNTFVYEGSVSFFYDGKLHLFDKSFQVDCLNNNNEVLLHDNLKSNQIFKWTPNNEMTVFLNDFSLNNVENSFNDKGQALGTLHIIDKESEQVLYNNGEFIFLKQIAEKFGVKLASFSQLNNNGTIIGRGKIWNEEHAIILRPIK